MSKQVTAWEDSKGRLHRTQTEAARADVLDALEDHFTPEMGMLNIRQLADSIVSYPDWWRNLIG